MIIISFKDNLKVLLKENNLKNIDLAKAIGIDRSTVTQYLNGQIMPSYEILEKIKIFFNCSYDDLLN